jgi:transposase
MIIIGVDFHPEFQQIASVDTDTGEFKEQRLAHREEGEKFLPRAGGWGQKVRLGMEASGHARWFERLMAALQGLFCLPWLSARISRSSLSRLR